MDDRIKEIVGKYGLLAQMGQTIEECAELIQALNKYKRVIGIGQDTNISKSEAKDNICEEIADVRIMLDQLIYLFDIEDKVQEMYEKKLKRTCEKMQHDESNIKPQTMSDWVLYTDKIPKENGEYLVTLDNGEVKVFKFEECNDDVFWYDEYGDMIDSTDDDNEVIAWMSLPKAYKNNIE